VPARSKDGRWKTKFSRFIERYGAVPLARKLGVTVSALYHWRDGSVHMRPSHAKQIVKLAAKRKVVLSLDDIYRNFDYVRGTLSRKN
jgi:hypothetical protein